MTATAMAQNPTRAKPARRAEPTRDAPGWGPLAVVLAGTFMTFLDFFIVNVALPSLSTGFGAGPATVQLVVAGYGLAFAVGMISGGRLGDVHGRRRCFSIGLAAFTVASAACGLAPSPSLLVVARILQGAAGALMTPQVLAILGTVYTGERRAKAFAAYGLTMGLAGVLGQLLGGAIIRVDLAGSDWRGVFLINLPVGLSAWLASVRVVPESRGPASSLDLAGTALATAGLVAIVIPLTEGQQYGWPLWTWLSLAASPLLLGGFVAHQRRRRAHDRAPLVDVALFGDRAFSWGSLASLTFALVPASFFFVLAAYLQEARGFSPLFSGVVFMAVGGGFFAAMLTAPRLAARLGRQLLSSGAVLVGVGCLVLAAISGHAGTSLVLLPGLALVGFGIGMVLVPLSALVLAGVPEAQVGAASGVLSTAQQVGGALGVAVIGMVFYRSAGVDRADLGHAFAIALVVIAGLTLATAAIVQRLPQPESAA